MITKVFNCNTDLCVDIKTYLRSDRSAQRGKNYTGMLRRDSEEHYSFIETKLPSNGKRNPRVFEGRFITITQSDDGNFRPNFRPINIGLGFNVERYANSVANELLCAFSGLVEEE